MTFEEYLRVVEDKTASFMFVCCQCTTILSEAEEKIFRVLTNYGFNLGMCYQIVDDYIDLPRFLAQIFAYDNLKNSHVPISLRAKVRGKDSTVTDIGMRQAEEFASKSKQSIKILPDSVYKEKLFNLVDYILNQNDKL